MVRVPRDLIKKLRTVVKEIPEEGVAVAWFADRYHELYQVAQRTLALPSAGTSGIACSA